MRKKKNKITAFILGALTALLAAVLIFCLSFTPASSGEHEIRNALPDVLNGIGYYKDGNMYSASKNGVTVIAQNVYSSNDTSPAFSVDYGIDKNSGKTVYLTVEKQLFINENGTDTLIASNVAGWRTFTGMSSIAFMTEDSLDSTVGNLYLYRDGVTEMLDTGITLSSVRFSQGGNYLFAQKPNIYPKTGSMLIRYGKDTREIAVESSMPIMWISDNGDTVICGSSTDESLYSYEIYYKDLKKKLTVSNVYFPEVSEDKSTLYLLCDYDTDIMSGTLKAFDLRTLKETKLAENVSFFTVDALTDSSKGAVYACLTDRDNGLYSIYYCNRQGKSYRLIKNTDEDAIYNVAIDTENKDGYILAPGKTRIDTVLYYIKFKGNGIETARIASGFLDSLVYYEKNGTATFIKDPSNAGGELYLAKKENSVLVCDNCSSIYNGSSGDYSANAVMNSDSSGVMYFSDITVSDDGITSYGTLRIKSGSEDTVLGENVCASYMFMPEANGDFSQIYFCKMKENGKYDVLFFSGETVSVIAEDTDGMFGIT